MQNNKIRAGTIVQNIVGASGMTQDEAWEAVRLAGVEAEIREMPMGIHTVLQQGGTTLSGGQRQRLLIAPDASSNRVGTRSWQPPAECSAS